MEKNQDGPNYIPELLCIRKSCPDIFIIKLDPPYLAYNDYTWHSFIHSFDHASHKWMLSGGRRRPKWASWRDSRVGRGNVWPGSRG